MNYSYPASPNTQTLPSLCKSVAIVCDVHENVQEKNINYLQIYKKFCIGHLLRVNDFHNSYRITLLRRKYVQFRFAYKDRIKDNVVDFS